MQAAHRRGPTEFAVEVTHRNGVSHTTGDFVISLLRVRGWRIGWPSPKSKSMSGPSCRYSLGSLRHAVALGPAIDLDQCVNAGEYTIIRWVAAGYMATAVSGRLLPN
jgi:hypothetical protein